MTIPPQPITEGLGKYTPELWKAGWKELQWLQQHRQQLEALLRAGSPADIGRDSLRVILTGYQLIGGAQNRFGYSWVEAEWSNSDNEYVQKTNGLTSSGFTNAAVNGIENGNNGLRIESGAVSVEGDDYPEGFFFQPIRGDDGTLNQDPGTSGSWTAENGPSVRIWLERDDTGAPRYAFDLMNGHDGTCAAP